MTDYHEYLLTPQWQTKRENVLIFWGHRCALCFSDINIEVHHRTYKRLGNELMTDLIALCSDCHSDHRPQCPTDPKGLNISRRLRQDKRGRNE